LLKHNTPNFAISNMTSGQFCILPLSLCSLLTRAFVAQPTALKRFAWNGIDGDIKALLSMLYEIHARLAQRGILFPAQLSSLLLVLTLLPSLSSAHQAPAGTQSSCKSAEATPAELFTCVIENQKKSEILLDEYERTERVEKPRIDGAADPVEVQFWRLFPTGTGVDKLALSAVGKPENAESYRTDLEKLVKYLDWVTEKGSSQRDAYAKAQRKRKERFELMEATQKAFLFTLEGNEKRGDRTLLRYSMTPNPKYRPTSRNTTVFTRVRGTIWIDEQSSQLAKIDGSVTEDISIGLFLGKVYKGSHFMQERYEVLPGIWEPTFEQYDFDGRKFMVPLSIHERTFYSDYKRVGPPNESVGVVRQELSKLESSHPPA
jgi:hypothetical protein